jgi:Lysyl oxidase
MLHTRPLVCLGRAKVTRDAVALGLFALTSLTVGCTDPEHLPNPDASDTVIGSSDDDALRRNGALVKVTATSRVGVVLDELPAAEREKLAAFYLAKPSEFWVDRAKHQLRHTTYRLTYRNYYYEEAEQRNMLALPPEEVWKIALSGKAKRVTTDDGHDAIEVKYKFNGTIVTDGDSPRNSEPELAKIGGVWKEPFAFPLDPEFLFQRTGYACADEDGYPLGTVQAENIYQMYDQDCDVETEETASCHLTHYPEESCRDALAAHVGLVDTHVRFERIAYNEATARSARVGTFTVPSAPDLAVMPEELNNNWIEYRYIPADSCALVEQCVGGPGWRRLLHFDATIKNTGAEPLFVGATDEDSPPLQHNLFEFSPCHAHYHFRHYGDFSYGSAPGDKRAFCVESTDRHYNNEGTPLVHEFGCENQGIAPGWGDTYIAGVECNWIDITDVEIPAAGLTEQLKFVLNPDAFICEGDAVLDEEGEPVYEATDFVTELGDPVDRPVCEFIPDYADNNVGQVPVLLPQAGGQITGACTRSQAGPLRDCGFKQQADNIACEPGSEVELVCKTAKGKPTQVLRVCDDSAKLGGIPCMFDAASANEIVDSKGVNVSFTCPEARDSEEPGGTYSLYVAPVVPSEGSATVTCKAK